MPRHLDAARFGRGVSWTVLAVVAIGLAPAVISIVVTDANIPPWVSVVSFVAGGVAAGFVSRRALASFACPRCGRGIGNHEPTASAPEAPIQFRCAACDVVWDSQLRTPSSL